jgi:hypothetical protein
MPDINLIGIHGPLNGGKDTVANYLQERYPERFNRYAFARPIKHACQVMFGFTLHQMEDRVLKDTVDPFWEFSPRRAMQLLGTEYGRDLLRKDVWIKRAELEHANNLSINLGTVITDVRFENEATFLREYPTAALIYINVPGLERDARYQHASEGGITDHPSYFHVNNDRSLGLRALHLQLDLLFERMFS